MIRRSVLCLLVVGLIPAAVSLTSVAQPSIPVTGRYLVVLNHSASAPEIVRRAAGLGGSVDDALRSVSTLVMSLPPAELHALAHDPRIAYIAPDRPVHLLDAASWPGQPAPTGVARIGAAPAARPNGSSAPGRPAERAAVAVLDTGIADRPDLNVVGGHDCVSGSEDVSGGGTTTDPNGHGTHVAGIVAGAGGSGVTGVSPGTPLYAVRVMGADGTGDSSNVICGLDWVAEHAAANNIKVVNLSIGGPGSDDGDCGQTSHDPLHTAVCRVTEAGVTVVAAAGNQSSDLANSSPASYRQVLAVTAMADFDGRPSGAGSPPLECDSSNKDDTGADFSNYAVPGSPAADHTIAAPGDCITSASNDGETEMNSGTSMASPHVAGIVARCIDAGLCAGLSPAGIVARLRDDAAARPAASGFLGDTRHPIPDRYYGDLVTVAGS